MTRKTDFFEGWSRFKFSDLGLILDTALKTYDTVAKGLKQKVIEFLGPTPTFGEVTGEKLVWRGGGFKHPIMNRVKADLLYAC